METSCDVAEYTLSMRGKQGGDFIESYIDELFSWIPKTQIDSVFGFVEKSTLYGGRPYLNPELSSKDLSFLYENKIGLRIPVSNKYVSRKNYEENLYFLDKYHKNGNTLIIVKDDFAEWVKKDFPLYRIEASAVKNINTHKKIEKALDYYDSVVLPAMMNNDLGFLNKVDCKSNVVLFANAGCAYNCTSRICYSYFSKQNKYDHYNEFLCSKRVLEREELGMVDFDLNVFKQMGYARFKVLRANTNIKKKSMITGF